MYPLLLLQIHYGPIFSLFLQKVYLDVSWEEQCSQACQSDSKNMVLKESMGRNKLAEKSSNLRNIDKKQTNLPIVTPRNEQYKKLEADSV